ncbi:S1/P1 nuclease [Bradyrhizobium sp. Leo170]|uniref:S1/P1 nuclease n=1 Tax=Bradyrhizobium sp. Leo170 TaxID=1571199 RepID=UPI00102ED342|nr:S1/P1 nuclease [Bradyrhizobium sp. Leo170]TAI62712.1 hypothetical protein CWO89_28195 [Bradyrhizobium sp. Leo170]
MTSIFGSGPGLDAPKGDVARQATAALRGYSSVFGAIFDADDRGGLGSVAVDADAEKVLDPDRWAQESFEAAKSFAYAQPVGLGPAAVQLTRDYETNARNTARNRAALAAARLAKLLDTALR